MQKSLKLCLLLLFFSGCNLFNPLEKRLISDNDKKREAALDKAANLPPEDQIKLVPFLQENMAQQDSRIANRSADALVALGATAVPALMESAQSSDIYVRLVAIEALGRLTVEAQRAIPRVLMALQDPHPLIREEAARTLGLIGKSDSNVKDALKIASQTDRVDTVRIAALEALN